jgi:hypothetical protein
MGPVMAVNLCKDCRFFRVASEVNPVTGDRFPWPACDRPREEGVKALGASSERAFDDRCGPEGRFFEPRASEAA